MVTMLPQCSHITRKRRVYYYRRRLPKPFIGEVAISLRTKVFLEADWLSQCLNVAFDRALCRMSEATKPADTGLRSMQQVANFLSRVEEWESRKVREAWQNYRAQCSRSGDPDADLAGIGFTRRPDLEE